VVDAGLLPPGTRLPPERVLAEGLAVSRGTVTAALDELRAEGRISSTQGRGSEVAGLPVATASLPHRIGTHFLDDAAAINLAAGHPPDASHLPPFSLGPDDLTAEGGGIGVSPQGLPALRHALAVRDTAEGVVADASMVHVTNGSHHGLAVVAQSVVGRGDAVVVEDPGYPGALDILDHIGARVVGLRRDQAGPDPHALDELLAEHRPALVYLQGGVHNPQGRIPATGRWRAIAEVLDAHAATVVDDRALVPLVDPADRTPPLAALCRRATVATLGSLGKVAWAGLRIGWLTAPLPLVERTVRLRTVTDLGTPVPGQIITLRLLPRIDELAAERRRTLASARARTLARLAAEAPELTTAEPVAGSALWIRLPVDDAAPVVQLARRHGVMVAPGSVARVGGGPDPHLRLCVDRPQPVIDEGITRLLRAWREARTPEPTVLG
jgi:DNA-binding transcriptional MocR family regulator